MFERIDIKAFGRHQAFDWHQHSQINLIIGENDTGKTQLLKLLYSIAKSLELYEKRKKTTNDAWSELLAQKMMWVFQPDGFELGRLVTRGEGNKAAVEFRFQEENLHFSFGPATTKIIKECSSQVYQRAEVNALYLPPKEVISAIDAIDATRKRLEIPGFDDTYIDLIDLLRVPTSKGKISKHLMQAMEHLQTATGGGEMKQEQGEFVFTRGREKYGMRSVAEGIRKVSVLSHLIRNRSLKSGSILFVDEPETNLHPRAIVLFVEMLYQIAKSGVQIYMATHSEFLLKRFEQLARENKDANFVRLLSLTQSAERNIHYESRDLIEGLPDNPIMEQTLSLYETDVRLDLQ
ncbi:AAA family ATPase [Thiothrix lacustris]|uniref:AAA family ATPase n=1 Tax=Thiothrix lacustris TaxID=525917 RepID=UPI0027E4A160|nr:AAA family ATPase [Thiothrix lacustris]WMP17090.1 AAA family ATPase [Thiothrix lacustris]